MRCPNCDAELSPDTRFCGDCGHPVPAPAEPPLVPTQCANCGADLSPDDQFCGECGHPAPAAAEPPLSTVRPAPPASAAPAQPRRRLGLWIVGVAAVILVAAIAVVIAFPQIRDLALSQVTGPPEPTLMARTVAVAPTVPATATAVATREPTAVVASFTPSPTSAPPTATPVPPMPTDTPLPPTATETETPVPPTPTPSPDTPTPLPVGDLLLIDDFSDPAASEFTTPASEIRRRYFEDGEYHILVKKAAWVSWGDTDTEFSDFSLEVEAHLVDGAGEGQYGLIFREEDGDNFYMFNISHNGMYKLRKQVDDEWQNIIEWTESSHVRTGTSTNHLRVVCRGSEITMYVNGHYLDTVTDHSFSAGKLGVFAGTFNEPNFHVAFDNLIVWSVPW